MPARGVGLTAKPPAAGAREVLAGDREVDAEAGCMAIVREIAWGYLTLLHHYTTELRM